MTSPTLGRAVLLCALAAFPLACGRFGFGLFHGATGNEDGSPDGGDADLDGDDDGASDADGDADTDGDADGDEDAEACVPAPETCDGIDNDCDDVVDEGCACEATTVACGTDPDWTPDVAWTGEQYVVVWASAGNILLRRFDGRLAPLGASVTVAATGDAVGPRVVATGEGFAIAWSTTGVMLQRFRADGLDMGSIGISEEGFWAEGSPALASGPPRIGVAWTHSDATGAGIAFALFDSSTSGTTVTEPVGIDASASPAAPVLAWNGSGFGLAWEDSRNGQKEIYFLRLGEDGTALGSEVRVSQAQGDSFAPDLAWTGEGYVLAWEDERGGGQAVYFAALGDDGSITTAETLVAGVSSSEYPQVVWTGSEVALTYTFSMGGDYDIILLRLSLAGAMLGDPATVTTLPWQNYTHALVAREGELGLAWHYQNAEGPDEVELARVCR